MFMIETKANANALFQGLKIKTSFTGVITIREGDKEAKLLREARTKIRSALRQQFRNFGSLLKDSRFRLKLVANRDLRFLDDRSSGNLSLGSLGESETGFCTMNELFPGFARSHPLAVAAVAFWRGHPTRRQVE